MEACRCQDGFGGVPQPPRLLTQSLPVANGLRVPSFCRRSFPGLSATAPPPPSRPLSYGKRRRPISAAASVACPSIRSSAARRRGGLNAAMWQI